MADSPYITWYTSDFLNGVASADMTAEQIGVYAVVLNLIGDAGGPIDDDPAWIARRCNISTRRAGMILNELAAMPNKIQRRNGLIGNRRMLHEVEKRDRRSRNAKAAADARWERWREEHKPQLPLAENAGKKTKKAQKPATPGDADAQNAHNGANEPGSPDYPADNPEINPEKKSEINSQKSQNSADPDANPHGGLARAAVNPESESIQTNDHSTLMVEGAENADARPSDFISLFELVCAAAGYCPTTTTAIAKAHDHVRAWRELGVDFTAVVIPTIQRIVHDSADHTSSLARFDRQIRHEHARSGAAQANGRKPPGPPPEPILHFDDEPELADAIRADVLKAMGPIAYANQAHSIRLAIEPWRSPEELILHVHTRGKWSPFWDGNNPAMMRHFAQKHGLTDAWKGR